MKRATSFYLSVLFLFCIQLGVQAQESNYVKKPGYYTLGINGGVAWQQGDIPTLLEGYGGGLTLAKNLYYKPGAPFAFDLRGRLLYTRTYGQDYDRSTGIDFNDGLNGVNGPDYTGEAGGPGFVFQNHKTDLGELGLEGVLTFNKLREKSNVILSLYGGIGLDWYNTKINQRDENGALYSDAYQSIQPGSSTSSIKNTLRENILDDSYETYAHDFGDESGNLRIMPSLGIELGYQLTPRFSMGVGHRVTFARNDILDGHQWNDNNTLTGDNDKHHYSSLHLRWELQPGSSKLKSPEVTITDPSFSPYKSLDNRYRVRATIRRVNSSMDVEATLNGRPIDFSFSGDQFSTLVDLQTGSNEIIVIGRNEAGSARDRVTITYQETVIDDDPVVFKAPTVRVVNPERSGLKTENDRYTFRAETENVDSKSEVAVTVNGRTIQDFEFDRRNGRVTLPYRLELGNNTFSVRVDNAGGVNRDEGSVFLEEPQPALPPRIEITNPSQNPHDTENSSINIRASVYEIESKRNIQMRVNGRNTSSFNFRGQSLDANVRLNEGRNIVEIMVSNESGTDRDDVVIYRERPYIAQPPNVSITRPSNNSRHRNANITVEANIRNVNSFRDIEVLVNGRNTSQFDFNNGRLRANVQLQRGNNNITVSARNQDGSDRDQVNVIYELIQTPPQVSITRPSNNSRHRNANITVEADIRNVSSSRDVEVQVNGRNLSRFDFNNGKLRANIQLQRGNNNITVSARNQDGSDSDQVNAIYELIQTPPQVSITRPSNNSRHRNANITVEADIRNVSSSRDVEVQVNGRNLNRFDFNNGKLRANIQLQRGNNNITVSARNQDGSDSDQVNAIYELIQTPPQVSITTPSSSQITTKVRRQTIRATTSNVSQKRDIEMVINGRNTSNFDFNSGSGSIVASVDLNEGNNMIKFIVRNDDGSDQDQVDIKYEKEIIVKPKRLPIVNITKPQNNSTIEQDRTELEATLKYVDSKNDVEVNLNGRRVSSFSFNSKTGKLTASLNLREGKNSILVTGSNRDGKADDKVSITYKKKVVIPSPTVKISSPKNRSTTGTEIAKFSASTTNVNSKGELRLTVNGQSMSSFSYRSGKVSAAINLKEGTNTIKLTATNKGGTDSDEIKVIYKKRILIPFPAVNITSPKNGSSVAVDQVKFTATTKAVNSKGELRLTLNGRTVRDFSYSSGKVNATLKLKEGSNRIRLTATNKGGTAKDEVNVTYKKKVVIAKPEIRFINPSSPGKTVTDKIFDMEAQIKNVKTDRDVDLYLNGKKINANLVNGKLIAVLQLKSGKNDFRITAKNAAGSAEATSNITQKSKIDTQFGKPKISSLENSTPIVSPFAPDKFKTTISARVEGVFKKDWVKLYIDGKLYNDFTFDVRRRSLTANVTFTSGEHTYKVVIDYGPDKVEKSKTVKF